MRYWAMQPDGGIVGPLEASEVSRLESFGPDSLVCPEFFHGKGDRAWLRAGFIGELRGKLPRALRLIPPDPSLAEAAVAGSLEKRVLELEDILLDALERLRERGRAVGELKRASREREREVLGLRATLKKISSRVGGLRRLEARLARMTDALEIKEQGVAPLRASFEDGLAEAARLAAESVAEARAVIREASQIAETAAASAEKAAAAARKAKKKVPPRRRKRVRPERKKGGPDPFA